MSLFLFDIILASCSLGAAQASIQKTGEYLKVRKQFGKTLDQFQVFRKKKKRIPFDYYCVAFTIQTSGNGY
jgi:hypothetical protein